MSCDHRPIEPWDFVESLPLVRDSDLVAYESIAPRDVTERRGVALATHEGHGYWLPHGSHFLDHMYRTRQGPRTVAFSGQTRSSSSTS